MKVVLENLTKIFPGRNKAVHEEVIAVNDFTFEIPDGKLIGLLGPSGCGKSTTLYMICGLQKPSSGKIYFGDDDVTELEPEHRGVGLVFQNYALYPHMTVKQNILFPLQNLRGEDAPSKEEMIRRAYEAARLVQIDNLMDRKPSELSGGQQQRVAIARALVKMPRVLLLDEPLSNLDARLRLQTREEIRRIQRETGITTVFVTHDQEEAMSISDMIVVMKLGVLQQIGKPQDVYDDPANLFVAKFLGTPPINVFMGEIKGGKVYVGNDCLFAVEDGIADQPIYVGIRPEGFIVDKNGPLHCNLSSVEVMGRDSSIVSTHSACMSANIRSIVDADCKVNPADKEVSFSLKPHKVFLFGRETQHMGLGDAPTFSYIYDPKIKALMANNNGRYYYLGTEGAKVTMTAANISFVTGENIDQREINRFVAGLYDPTADQTKVRKPIKESTLKKFGKLGALIGSIQDKKAREAYSVDKAYYLTLHNKKLVEGGLDLYFNGTLVNGELGTTANIDEAVAVYIEPTYEEIPAKKEGAEPIVRSTGFALFFMNGNEKVYINVLVENDKTNEKRIRTEVK